MENECATNTKDVKTENSQIDKYREKLHALINDIYYVEGVSRDGCIARMRTLAELFIRKILDLPQNAYVTTGNKEMLNLLAKKSGNNELLMHAVKKINKYGNARTHTNDLSDVTEKEVSDCEDAIFDLYAYLFVDFFERNAFGKDNKILTIFSLLPPVIRWKVLSHLYKTDKTNEVLVDKLALAQLKTFGKDDAFYWIESEKSVLLKIPSMSEETKSDIRKKFPEEVAEKIISNAPQNMYECCTSKMKLVSNLIESSGGPAYETFEKAKPHYEKYIATVELDNDVQKEFKKLMDFCYAERKAQLKENACEWMMGRAVASLKVL